MAELDRDQAISRIRISRARMEEARAAYELAAERYRTSLLAASEIMPITELARELQVSREWVHRAIKRARRGLH